MLDKIAALFRQQVDGWCKPPILILGDAATKLWEGDISRLLGDINTIVKEGAAVAILSSWGPQYLYQRLNIVQRNIDVFCNDGALFISSTDHMGSFENRERSQWTVKYLNEIKDKYYGRSGGSFVLDGERLLLPLTRDHGSYAERQEELNSLVASLNYLSSPPQWVCASYDYGIAIERYDNHSKAQAIERYIDRLCLRYECTREELFSQTGVVYLDGGVSPEVLEAMQAVWSLQCAVKDGSGATTAVEDVGFALRVAADGVTEGDDITFITAKQVHEWIRSLTIRPLAAPTTKWEPFQPSC